MVFLSEVHRTHARSAQPCSLPLAGGGWCTGAEGQINIAFTLAYSFKDPIQFPPGNAGVSTPACRLLSLAYMKLPRANCFTLFRQWIRCAFNLTLLSGLRHKYDDVRCAQFGLWRGARRAHPLPWGCNRRATKPQAKFGATQRAAGLFRPDFVARSSQIHCGICSSLTPRPGEKSLAANVIVFMPQTTKGSAPCRGRKLRAANVTGLTLI